MKPPCRSWPRLSRRSRRPDRSSADAGRRHQGFRWTFMPSSGRTGWGLNGGWTVCLSISGPPPRISCPRSPGIARRAAASGISRPGATVIRCSTRFCCRSPTRAWWTSEPAGPCSRDSPTPSSPPRPTSSPSNSDPLRRRPSSACRRPSCSKPGGASARCSLPTPRSTRRTGRPGRITSNACCGTRRTTSRPATPIAIRTG